MTRSSRWLPVLAAGSAAIVHCSARRNDDRYRPLVPRLKKPDWQPPDWIFGPAWTVIFALAALSGATAWRDAPTDASREWVIGLFALNGLLNILWTALFFRLHRPDWALVEVLFLWLSILVPILVFSRYSRAASLLLVPYLAWVSFAAYLNYTIVKLNGPFGGS